MYDIDPYAHLPERHIHLLDYVLDSLEVPTGGFIAGGFIRRMLNDENLFGGDIDLFFANQKQFEKFIHELTDRTDATDLNTESDKYAVFRFKSWHVQAMTVVYGTPAEVLGQFDFTLCQLAYTRHNLWVGPLAMRDVKQRNLRLTNSMPYPLSTYFRMFKYLKSGYKPTPDLGPRLLEQITRAGNCTFTSDQSFGEPIEDVEDDITF